MAYLFRLVLVLVLTTAWFPALPAHADSTDEEYQAVEVMPAYPGGLDSMRAFMQRRLVYPEEDMLMDREGTVYIEVLISVTGYIREAKVVKSVSPTLDAEALRLVELMPPWNPGTQDGKAVKVRMTIPVKFRLELEEPLWELLAFALALLLFVLLVLWLVVRWRSPKVDDDW